MLWVRRKLKIDTRLTLGFIGSVLIAGVVVNVASGVLMERYSRLSTTVTIVVLAVGSAVLLGLLARNLYLGITATRYAVSAVVLDGDGRMLTYRHPHHKVNLWPGGRVGLAESPHAALAARLRERLGLEPADYEYDERFHPSGDWGFLGNVERVAAPFIVQRELERQRSRIRAHYDLVYVLRLTRDRVQIDSDRYAPVEFRTLDDLVEMERLGRTFPDLVAAYRQVHARVRLGEPV